MLHFIIVILSILELIVALLLIGLILIQRSKSSGLGAISGGVTEEVFGGGASKVLVRATTVLLIIFLVNTLVLASLSSRVASTSNLSKVEDSRLKPETPAPNEEK